MNSPILVENNSFDVIAQYGISCRGSNAKIYGNLFRKCGSSCISIVGKRRFPVVGGSLENSNTFQNPVQYTITNDSRNEINAQYNYWGIVATSIMDKVGYPAEIDAIFDYWDGENRVNGKVDYRNWLAAPPGSEPAGDGVPFLWIVGIFVGAMALLGLVLRKRAA